MSRFAGFVLFAEMRTGSNHLEESLNQAPGLTCHGEVFNPRFVGAPGQDALCGVDRAARDADPGAMLDALAAAPGVNGFRLFHDHDRRVLDHVLLDPRWAKVMLTRDAVERYVSLRIAETTGQWRITDGLDRKSAQVTFDPEDFADRTARSDGFRAGVRQALRHSGQVPFELDYSEILDLDVLNGLLAFLGIEARITAPSARLKRQNPGPLHDKVTNPDEMARFLAGLGHGATGPAPDLAPMRAGLRVAERTLFMAVPGVPTAALPGYDAATPLPADQLRPWLNRTKGHHVIAAVSHPVARAWRLLQTDAGSESLHDFIGRVTWGGAGDPAVQPQAALLCGMATEVLPDQILRADDRNAVPDAQYSAEVESAARDVYNPDYRLFGYGKWRR